ncbi:hypothetical protein BJ170DRAFT_684158 [Xylariales sp. AK1849]|nr:hypothetical protein BJ170DRAFT_684158 [Xylariales sp. AK1849]
MSRQATEQPARCRNCGCRPGTSTTFTSLYGIYRNACDECSRWTKTSCLSTEPHDDTIKEYLYHYLGCIEFWERNGFFDVGNPLWQIEVKHLINLGKSEQDAKAEVNKKRVQWESDCKSALRRIDFLRYTLSMDPNEQHLITKIDESREKWRHCEEYTRNIAMVGIWRTNILGKPPRNQEVPSSAGTAERTPYTPEKDTNVGIVHFEGNQISKSAEVVNDRVWGSFPDQKTTVENLLYDQRSQEDYGRKHGLLYKDRPEHQERLRYFHFPSNNMAWVEKAIAQYFGQRQADYEAMHRDFRNQQRNETYDILRPSYWRGQFHGGLNAPAHARYMRPGCEAISSSMKTTDPNPKNMVLYMPYLHWDTSRQRERFSREIDSAIKDWTKNKEEEELAFEKERKKRWEWLHNSLIKLNKRPLSFSKRCFQLLLKIKKRFCSEKQMTETAPPPPRIDSIPAAVRFTMYERAVKGGKAWNQLVFDRNGRPEIESKQKELGQYLLDAARLYEGISNYRDKKLLQKYLESEPPCLHPRRTLDQAYYWTLDNTRSRDRDQVVYRSTTANLESFHRYRASDCKWPKHEEYHIDGNCNECRANIQKVSRVVMVDQLWMWILDAKTIITYFPKRYGVNRHDPTGVHKAIRTRIRTGQHQIRSVFDLALIILDECSNTFFDRTKTGDRQPQVIDAFSTAIGNVMHKQTIAFEKLWHWTQRASGIYRSGEEGDGIHITLLDIYHEGQLEREIKDIIEEVGIMIHITKTHRDILKSFVKNAKQILDSESKSPEKVAPANPLQGQKPQQSSAGPRQNPDGSMPAAAQNLRTPKDQPRPAGTEDYKSQNEEEKTTSEWFTYNAEELTAQVVDRIEQLEELEKSALATAANVKDLLDLKQQQASVVQAWHSMRQSEDSIKQARSLMVLTVVTIIFLPLSFMSSVFGMNAIEFSNDNNWTILQEFKFMFPISAGIIVLTFMFAFGDWTRASVWYLYTRVITWVVVKSGAYRLWLAINRPSTRLHKSATAETNRLKKQIRKKRTIAAERRLDEEEKLFIASERRHEEQDKGTQERKTGSNTCDDEVSILRKRMLFWRKDRVNGSGDDPEAGH